MLPDLNHDTKLNESLFYVFIQFSECYPKAEASQIETVLIQDVSDNIYGMVYEPLFLAFATDWLSCVGMAGILIHKMESEVDNDIDKPKVRVKQEERGVSKSPLLFYFIKG